MGFPWNRQQKSESVGITESGRQFAHTQGYAGPQFLVLAALADRSPQSMTNLERQTRMNRKILTLTLRQLASQGFVQYAQVEN